MNRYALLLRQPAFRWLAAADAISVTGDSVGWIALLWFVMLWHGHAYALGLLAAAFGLPTIVVAPFVGAIFDRFQQKSVMVWVNLALCALYVLIPVLSNRDALTFPTLLCILVLAGCLTPFTTVGWMVLLPKTVQPNQLDAANAVSEGLWQLASLLGPILAGVLIARFGAASAIWMDGLSFFLAALCIWPISVEKPTDVGAAQSHLTAKTHGSDALHLGLLRETWQGVAKLFELPVVLYITLAALLLNTAFGALDVSLPIFVHRQLSVGAVVLGGLWTAYFIGAIIGSAAIGLLATSRFRRGWLLVGAVMGWGLSLLPLLFWHTVPVALVCLALGGFMFSMYPPLARTTVVKQVPESWHGRVMGARMAIIGIGVPAGSMLSGFANGILAPSLWIGCTGVVLVLMAVGLALLPSFRNIT